MVRLILPALIGTLVIGVCQTRAQEFPYVAFVTEADAYVRSGPSQKYYPTQQLPQGFAVEVYRHDGEGWCAVRPPAGSFSWVAAHQVRLTNQGMAEVATEGVVTRIGSTLSPTRSTVQVLLPKGERVEILPNVPTDKPGWLRIAAPAGEFRWIAAKHLSLEPPVEVAPPLPSGLGWENPANANRTEGTTTRQAPNAFGHLRKINGLPAGNVPVQQPQQEAIGNLPFKTSNHRTSTNFASESMDVVAGSPAEMQMAQFPAQDNGISTSTLFDQSLPVQQVSGQTEATLIPDGLPSSTQFSFHGLSASDRSLAERLEELKLRLSQTVTQPQQEWHFEQLRFEANNLLEKSDSSEVRSQVRNLLDRVTRFEEVRLGYEKIAKESAVLKAFEEQPKPLEPPEVAEQTKPEDLTGMSSKIRQMARQDLKSPVQTVSSDTPTYDAVGLLKSVSSKRASAPQYALVDEQGEVVSFITPTPDLNLKPYLGRQIGVRGKRGYMSEYRRAHVTVAQVSPIKERIRR